MDRPGSIKNEISVGDSAFFYRINLMLLEDAQLSDDSDIDDPVDDSDADPDYILSEEEEQDDLVDVDDEDDNSNDEEEEPERELLTIDNSDLPEYIFGRMRKNESDPTISMVYKKT